MHTNEAPSGPAGPNRMPNNNIETFQIVKWIAGPATGNQQIPELLAANEETYRPVIRPAVPILTVLDDGSVDEGEQIRLRTESFVIGRSSGDLVIPNDATMSGRHAEIRLTTSRGQRQWTLHNLESVNGTFVRVGNETLADDTIIILGSAGSGLRSPWRRSRIRPAKARSGSISRPTRNSSVPSLPSLQANRTA